MSIAIDGPGSDGSARPEAAGTNYRSGTPAGSDHTATGFEPGVAVGVVEVDTAAVPRVSRTARTARTPRVDSDSDNSAAWGCKWYSAVSAAGRMAAASAAERAGPIAWEAAAAAAAAGMWTVVVGMLDTALGIAVHRVAGIGLLANTRLIHNKTISLCEPPSEPGTRHTAVVAWYPGRSTRLNPTLRHAGVLLLLLVVHILLLLRVRRRLDGSGPRRWNLVDIA